MKKVKESVQDVMAYINKSLGYKTLLKPPTWWLDTGYPRLNAVMGSPKYGLASGKVYLIAGKESSGKSLIAAMIAGLGQKKKAEVGWIDVEESFDRAHVRRQGLHGSKVALFTPLYGQFKLSKKSKKNAIEEVEPAEYMLTRVELWMKLMRKKNPDGKIVLVLDSTNALSPKEEQEAGYTDSNMRTKIAPAVFLNMLTKRLSLLAVHTNAIVILISQLRTNPAKMFGNPDYIPGGGGLKYHPSSIVWMRRVADGAIREGGKEGKQIGVKGLITNTKNKVGGGSIERKKAGYIAYFYKNNWQFISSSKIKKEK
jgi:RecA/RadA recombinase